MLKWKPAQENEMHKILKDFEIQTDHLIPARRLDIGIVTRERERERERESNKRIEDFAVPADYKAKIKENENR